LDDFLHSMLYHSINELGQKCRRNICPFIHNATSHKYRASTCHQLLSFNKKNWIFVCKRQSSSINYRLYN
jgi:hypothetical protein